jgi:HD-like signal output (HDOD) protein
MQHMNESGGFPALAQSVGQIVRALEEGAEDTTTLTNAVLADLSLTQKVLTLANSAMYAPIARNVSSVSHALMVLGFEAVGHLALGVKLISSLGQIDSDNPAAEHELAHSLLAGSIASTVVGKLQIQGGEEGVVCALLHRTGRLLTAFFLPEEWQLIQERIQAGHSEKAAAEEVLGSSFEDLGIQIARKWRLPTEIVATMQPRQSGDPSPEAEGRNWLADVTRFANQAADVLSSAPGEEARQKHLETLATRYGASLGLKKTDLMSAVRQATDEASAEPLLAKVLLDHPRAPSVPPAKPTDVQSRLQGGLEEVRQAIAEGGSPTEVLHMALEVMYTSLELGRAAVFLRAPTENVYRVRATLSAREPNRLVGLSFPDESAPNVASLSLSKGADIYIDNPRDTKISHRLPNWLHGHDPHPFFLLPLILENGQSFGLVFGQQKDDRLLTKSDLATLAKLRDLMQSRVRGPTPAP